MSLGCLPSSGYLWGASGFSLVCLDCVSSVIQVCLWLSLRYNLGCPRGAYQVFLVYLFVVSGAYLGCLWGVGGVYVGFFGILLGCVIHIFITFSIVFILLMEHKGHHHCAELR